MAGEVHNNHNNKKYSQKVHDNHYQYFGRYNRVKPNTK